MPITPGSSVKLNTLSGLSTLMVTTSAEETTLATKILPAGMLVKKSNGKIYLTDGVSTLANLPILIDSVLTTVEKGFLSSAVDNGSYARAAGGVVVHGSGGKISDDSLNIVTSGKITESYLSDYIDPVTHKVLLSALPDTVRAGVTYVADITARDALSAEQKKSLAFVIDASDDASVGSGAAMYGWDATANSNAGAWVKIAEVESMDLDVAALRCDYPNTEAAGAVMYSHMVHLTPDTATEFVTMQEAAESQNSGNSGSGGSSVSVPSGEVWIDCDSEFRAAVVSQYADYIDDPVTGESRQRTYDEYISALRDEVVADPQQRPNFDFYQHSDIETSGYSGLAKGALRLSRITDDGYLVFNLPSSNPFDTTSDAPCYVTFSFSEGYVISKYIRLNTNNSSELSGKLLVVTDPWDVTSSISEPYAYSIDSVVAN